ncbi:MAG: sulfotransferase [Gammaproteobacteria bacterium]|nr:sulfotransferase [Gammaproteobacteria bacterium]MCP4090215.1 sulfotransferase [Gammaproteobacteria bacterium]MCP4832966.1 sulfotransferase [Gammaproteobacteria bacterium]
MKPTYIGIGVQKSASTWLHRILAEHPEVAVPERKEINFFSFYFDHGYQWYEAQFPHSAAQCQLGEISPSYFCEQATPERIYQYLPQIKILLILRDPIQRALSNHRHEIRVGHITGSDLSFETGLLNNPMYIEQGLYATQLKRWLEYFPLDQIKIVLMEEIKSDPLAVAKDMYKFLGVNEAYQPIGLNQKFNQSYANRSHSLTRLKDIIYNATRIPGLSWIWNLGSKMGLKMLYRNINTSPSNAVIPEPTQQTLDMLRERFEPEVRELQAIIGRPLDAWLK